MNASLDAEQGDLLVKRAIHVGVAVDTERGLLVPVVRDADRKNILELSADLAQLSERAHGGKLKPDEMKGSGFTLTNLGTDTVDTFMRAIFYASPHGTLDASDPIIARLARVVNNSHRARELIITLRARAGAASCELLAATAVDRDDWPRKR